MILHALYELAQQEGLVSDPDYEFKPVAWLVRVDKGGTLLSIESTHYLPEGRGRQKPRPTAKAFPVPRQPGRTSGDRAFFLCDKAEYVFGLDPQSDRDKRRPEGKLAARFDLFRDQVKRCADETGDDGVRAVASLLAGIAAGKVKVTLPEGCASNDLFAFVYAPDIDRLVHERDKARAYWSSERYVDGGGAAGEARCLVTGKRVSATGNFPLLKKVPGGTQSGVALVSFNKRAFESYGWSENENAVISRDAAEACATALNRLLHPAFPDPRPEHRGGTLPRRNFVISDDTIVCFWASNARADSFLDSLPFLMMGNDAGKVGDLYRSVWKGKAVKLDDAAAFYALTISGTQGRAIVRDWFESSVAEVAVNVARHFADLAIVRNTPAPKGTDLPPQIPLRVLLGALASPGESGGVPGQLGADFVAAALRGTRYPLSILQRALERMRAEMGRQDEQGVEGWRAKERNDARAALIKAVLRRNMPFKEIEETMDPTNTNPGYLLGRLMAIIERLQQAALGDVSAGIVDRYFAAASATPRAVFTRLLKNARHHASKAKDDPQMSGTAGWLERQIDEIASRFDPKHNGFPAYLDLVQQGLFVLGYHQQRHWLWMSKEERERLSSAAAAATTTA
jgi:CRISPR-associated protein Csd1